MVKHTQTIRRLLPTNSVSVFDHFVRLALKGLSNTFVTFEAQCKKNLSNTEVALKKSVAYKKSVYIEKNLHLIVRKCCELSNIICLACYLYIFVYLYILYIQSSNFLFIFLILNPNLQNLIVSLLDINECDIPNFRDTCHTNATCVNEVGTFSCVCNAGFFGDGQECSDIDECQQTNNCSDFATCANTIGSYVCTCLDGFSGDGFTCLGMIFS